MIVAELRLFELLKAKIGEKEAEAFVHVLETQVDEKLKDFKSELATKEYVTAELAKMKVELIKWMVGLIFGLFIALVGALATIIKVMIH